MKVVIKVELPEEGGHCPPENLSRNTVVVFDYLLLVLLLDSLNLK